MSRYNTLILSFGFSEIPEPEDDEEWVRDCEPLRMANAWLEGQGYEPLDDMAGGWLGQNVCLFGGCYNHLIPDEAFLKMIRGLPWKAIEDVRILFWDEEDETFTVVPIHESAEAQD